MVGVTVATSHTRRQQLREGWGSVSRVTAGRHQGEGENPMPSDSRRQPLSQSTLVSCLLGEDGGDGGSKGVPCFWHPSVPCKSPLLLLKSHSCALYCRDWGEPKPPPPSLRCRVLCVHDESVWPETLLAAWHSTHYKDTAAVAATPPPGNTQFRIETSL